MSPQTPNFDCLLPEPLGNSYTLVPVKDDPYAISIPSPPSPDVQSQLLPIDQIKEEFVTKVTKKNCQSHPYGRPCNRTKLAFGSTFCLVCGDLAVCNACAAFFRRTVSSQKAYICKKKKSCVLQGTEPRHMCKFCRFQKCIQSGMMISNVMAPLTSQSATSSNNYLSTVVLARRANFVNRIRATLQAYGGHDKIILMANKHKDAASAAKAVKAETRVVKEFLVCCGIRAEHFSNLCMTTLMHDLFFSWILFLFIDESYLDVNEPRMVIYYSTDPNIRHPGSVARHAVEYFKEVVQLSAKFHEARLDDMEQAALSLILIITSAKKLIRDNNLFAEQLNLIFRSLKKHYDQTYNDIAIRMGNVVLLLDEFQRVRHLFHEHLIMQKLAGKKNAYYKMIEANENPLQTFE
uniref:Nuclear receptor domain-containing protein n=1 Tax=Ditylenchus dipsaci TaxID=166011 RepID=A0A915DVG1_9BILA